MATKATGSAREVLQRITR